MVGSNLNSCVYLLKLDESDGKNDKRIILKVNI